MFRELFLASRCMKKQNSGLGVYHGWGFEAHVSWKGARIERRDECTEVQPLDKNVRDFS